MNGTVIDKPCINKIQINDKSDFILLGCKNKYLNIFLFHIL